MLTQNLGLGSHRIFLIKRVVCVCRPALVTWFTMPASEKKTF